MTEKELEKYFNIHVFDGFDDIEDVERYYEVELDKDNIVILSATYDCAYYEGESHVYFYDMKTSLFYEVHAYHCSCYGLEGQWEPEEIGDLDFTIVYLNRRGASTILK